MARFGPPVMLLSKERSTYPNPYLFLPRMAISLGFSLIVLLFPSSRTVLHGGCIFFVQAENHKSSRNARVTVIETRTLNLLDEKKYEKCLDDLLLATSVYDYTFEVPAYLKFIEYQSNGLVSRSKFDVDILELVHIYWMTVCSVRHEMCYKNASVPVQDVIVSNENGGNRVVYKLCDNVDLYLQKHGWTRTSQEPSTAIPSLSHTTNTVFPMQAPTSILADGKSQNPSLNHIQYDSSHDDAGPSHAPLQSQTTQPSGVKIEPLSMAPAVMSLSPSSLPGFTDITIDVGPYDVEFDALCQDQEFYQSAKNKSALRIVFYDKAMTKLQEALGCAEMDACLYEIFLIAAFDSFVVDINTATVTVSMSYSIYIKPQTISFDKTQIITAVQQATDSLMQSDDLQAALTSSTRCNFSSLSPSTSDITAPSTIHNDTCIDNLIQALSEYNNLFTKAAYLKFIALESNGDIEQDDFTESIQGLVQIYWWTVCTIKSEECTEDSVVTTEEILSETDVNSGKRVTTILCQKIQEYLEHHNTFNKPSNIPSNIHSSEPTSAASQQPVLNTNSPSTFPSHLPSTSTISTVLISSLPSVSMSLNPSQTPTSLPSTSPTSKYARCIGDILQAATASGSGVFTKEAFVSFVNVYSGGLLEIASFAESPFQIVQIYWFAVCSVLGDSNCNEESTITLAELLSFEFEDGTRIVHDTCNSVDDYLFVHVFTRPPSTSPTSLPSESNRPSVSPSGVPSSGPSSSNQPSVSGAPSEAPTVSPTLSVRPTASVVPSHVPSVTKSHVPSESPSQSKVPSSMPSNVPSKVVSAMPSMSQTPSSLTSGPSIIDEDDYLIPSASPTAFDPKSILLFRYTFTIEYSSECVTDVILSYVRDVLKESGFDCTQSNNDCVVSLSLNLIPLACPDSQASSLDVSCALVNLSGYISPQSELNQDDQDSLSSSVRESLNSQELDLLINSPSLCSPSSVPSISMNPIPLPSHLPSVVPSHLSSSVPSVHGTNSPSQTITLSPSYTDAISLYFSIEYLINDVRKVLEDSINAVAAGVIQKDNNCNVVVQQKCQDPSFHLDVSVYETSICPDPVDTLHKCAFVDLRLTLNSAISPVDSLRETMMNAIKLALSDGTIDELINAPSQ